MSKQEARKFISALALITWAGTRYFAIDVIRRTAQKVHIALTHRLSPAFVKLPSGKLHYREEKSFLVPKEGVRMVEEQKCETDGYEGAVYGYGGTVDRLRGGRDA